MLWGARSSGPLSPALDLAAQAIGVVLITGSQAAINHLGIGVTARLTDFSGYWILLVATAADSLPAGLCPASGAVAAGDLRELQRHRGRGRLAGNRGLVLLFALGALLPAYTITGFDASAHAAEETIGASKSVPRGIVRSVLVSGVVGWVLLVAMVLAAPSLPQAAAGVKGRFSGSWTACSLGRWPWRSSRDRRGPVPVRTGHGDLGLADGVRFRPRRRPALLGSRAMGMPQAAVAGRRHLDGHDGIRPVHSVHSGLFDDHRCMHDLPLHLLCAADGPGRPGVRADLDGDGPLESRTWYRPLAVLSVAGCAGMIVIGMQPPNERSAWVVGGVAVVLLLAWFGGMRHRFAGPPRRYLVGSRGFLIYNSTSMVSGISKLFGDSGVTGDRLGDSRLEDVATADDYDARSAAG